MLQPSHRIRKWRNQKTADPSCCSHERTSAPRSSALRCLLSAPLLLTRSPRWVETTTSLMSARQRPWQTPATSSTSAGPAPCSAGSSPSGPSSLSSSAPPSPPDRLAWLVRYRSLSFLSRPAPSPPHRADLVRLVPLRRLHLRLSVLVQQADVHHRRRYRRHGARPRPSLRCRAGGTPCAS